MSKEIAATHDVPQCIPWKVVFEGSGWNSTTFVVDMAMLAKHSAYFRALLEGQYSEGADQLVSLDLSQLGNAPYRRVISGFNHFLSEIQTGWNGPLEGSDWVKCDLVVAFALVNFLQIENSSGDDSSVLEKLILDLIEKDFSRFTINKYCQEYQAFHGPFNLESLLVRLVIKSFNGYSIYERIDITTLDESVIGAIAECVKENSEKVTEIHVLQFFYRILSTKSVSKEIFEKMTCKSVLPTFPFGSIRDESCGILFLEYEQRLGLSDPPPGASTTCLQARVNYALAKHFENKLFVGGEMLQGGSSIHHRFLALPAHVKSDILIKQQLLIRFSSEKNSIVRGYSCRPEVYHEKMQQLEKVFTKMFEGIDKATTT